MALSAPYYYQVTASRVLVEDAGIVTTYGVAIVDVYGNRLHAIDDITMNIYAVTAFCDRLRDEGIDLLQLRDAVVDWLNDL